LKISNLEDDTIEIGIAGAGKTIESSTCTAEFIKAILNGYGYSLVNEEVESGTIRMIAKGKRSF
jgi:ABC-type proline/glycine betaine transport system substrate-binding protein